MNCPACTPTAGEGGPYRRDDGSHVRRTALVRERHPAGFEIDRCPSCSGTWLDPGELEAVQTYARGHLRVERAEALDGVMRRAYARGARREPRPERACLACGDEMFEREWGFGSQILADVCLGCRGVWLDGGELEDVEQFFAAPR